MTHIIAQMVGRNEEDRYLEEVLDHLKGQVDMIVFTDDASTDRTPKIASKYAEVFRLPEPMFSVHEGQLRQAAWSNLEKFATEDTWVLAIDADEKFYPTPDLEYWINQREYDVLSVTFHEMWNETHYRVDKAWGPTVSSRLFRYRPNATFKDKALACGSEPTYVSTLIRAGRFNRDTGFRMQHLGYKNDIDKAKKYERYMTLDGGKYHNKSHIESIMDKNVKLVEWKE